MKNCLSLVRVQFSYVYVALHTHIRHGVNFISVLGQGSTFKIHESLPYNRP
jgi:hypothetical protein